MVETAVLPMLYEFLISESRYEARGNEYRARLRSLFEEMLLAQQSFPQFDMGIIRSINIRIIDEMVSTVGFIDQEDVFNFGLLSYPGIRHYAYPEIPDFCYLNMNYLKVWHDFFGLLDKRERGIASNKPRRHRAEDALEESPSYTDTEEESSSDSDSSYDSQHPDVVITADDILCPRTTPDGIDELLCPNVGVPADDPGEVKDKRNLLWRRSVPFYMDSSYKIDHGNLVFGLINDTHLSHEWACNSSYAAYESRIQRFVNATKDPGDDVEDMDVEDVGIMDGSSDIEMDDASVPVEHPIDKKSENSAELTEIPVDIADTERAETVTSGPFTGLDQETGCLLDNTTVVNTSFSAADLPPFNLVRGAMSSAATPYNPKCIFGNYHCDVPAGHQRTLGSPVKSLSQDIHNYTRSSIDLRTTMVMSDDGIPQLSCVGTLGERQEAASNPRLDRYGDRQITLQNRLERAITGLFTIKNAVSSDCTACSGWSLNNGVSIVFCEICEDRLLYKFDPAVVNRLFELRRSLVSELYPSLGYTFVNHKARDSLKGDVCSSYVTIPGLCDIGGVYPKASIHDGRYTPNTLDIPRKALYELGSLVLSNGELFAYGTSGSKLLPLCVERRAQRLESFDHYFEELCKLRERNGTGKFQTLLSHEFDNVFKRGKVPFMKDTVGTTRRFFNELTSSLLHKLPMDPVLLRSMFYYGGIYMDPAYGGKDSLSGLIVNDRKGPRSTSQAPVLQWHSVASKYSIVRTSGADSSSKSYGNRTRYYRMRPGLYQEYVKRTGILARLPAHVRERIETSGNLSFGFPTSLQMHIAGIPDVVLDPHHFSRPGMSFFFSMPGLLQNLAALCLFMWGFDQPIANPKRRASENISGRPVH
ncbi:putative integral membrane protein [Babesia bovis T2Bo]|uniref:Uncharacterized protein n=1 Tax=Babesia bovis TaxID=5865 RepID=A7AUF7_BABBO|nr:putative integral membrane protein [Babesia bovis T2Bo]EDO06568.1 putative integral membrane protein [Babesia bovis T2Bo]|eukprot:XP_001610136.1 hypothetical protein [Babesia bovis T2Bo]